MKDICLCTTFRASIFSLAAGAGLLLASAAFADGKGRGEAPKAPAAPSVAAAAPKTTHSTSTSTPHRAAKAGNPWSNLSPAMQARHTSKTPVQLNQNGGIAGVPGNDLCGGAFVIFDGDTAFDNTGAATDGPPTACNGFADPQINQDIWYNYTATATDTVTVKLCGSTYDTKMAIHDGCGCSPLGPELVCNDDFCGLQSQVSTAVIAGNCYKIRVGGYTGASGSGNINIAYGGGSGPCGNAGHDCCTAGGPGCDDVDCCNAVCANDSFCCDTAWDTICVGEVDTFCANPCPSPCGNAGHDCFTPGGPGCDDADCCNTVCALDSFCCQVAWDGVCVSEAQTFCGPPCDATCPAGAIQEGEPCGSDTNGGCNSTPPVYGTIGCNQTVCGTQWADGNTRDTDWYHFTITTNNTVVHWKVWSQFPSVAFILNDDCGNIVLLGNAGSVQCPLVASPDCGFLNAGTYVAFVAPAAFVGDPCGGGNNDYYGVLECHPPCVGDTNGTGTVNVDDLLDVINHWGPCPP